MFPKILNIFKNDINTNQNVYEDNTLEDDKNNELNNGINEFDDKINCLDNENDLQQVDTNKETNHQIIMKIIDSYIYEYCPKKYDESEVIYQIEKKFSDKYVRFMFSEENLKQYV
jgi:hypothetical protein